MKYLLLLLILPMMIIPAFAVQGIIPFDEFCEIKTNNSGTTAADFICKLDIFQMKDDIQTLQGNPVSITTTETNYEVILNVIGNPNTFMDFAINDRNGHRILTDANGEYSVSGIPFGTPGNYTAIVSDKEYSARIDYTWEIQPTPEVVIPDDGDMVVSVTKDYLGGGGFALIIFISGAEGTVSIEIIAEDGTILNTLSFRASSQGEVNQPWIIPRDTPSGTYVVKATDAFNSAETTFDYVEPDPSCGAGTVFDEIINSCVLISDDVTITVQTDDNQYNEGDTIVISGQVTPIIGSTLITLQLFTEGNLVDIAQITVAQDGSYSHTVIAEGPLWNKSGDYTVKVSYGEGNIAESVFSYTFNH